MKIVVAANSLTVPNPMQKEHLHGANWLDVAKYPEITFEAKSLANVKTTDNVTTAGPVACELMPRAVGRRVHLRPDGPCPPKSETTGSVRPS